MENKTITEKDFSTLIKSFLIDPSITAFEIKVQKKDKDNAEASLTITRLNFIHFDSQLL